MKKEVGSAQSGKVVGAFLSFFAFLFTKFMVFGIIAVLFVAFLLRSEIRVSRCSQINDLLPDE